MKKHAVSIIFFVITVCLYFTGLHMQTRDASTVVSSKR